MTISKPKYNFVFRAVLCVSIAMTVAACGIKPGSLTPPAGDNAPYPAQYPKDTQPVINPYIEAVEK